MSLRILVLEDEQSLLPALEEIIQKAGYSPVLCSTLAEAEQELVKGTVHAVIFDVVIREPQQNRRVQTISLLQTQVIGTLPFVLLSASVEGVEDSIRSLALEVIPKPPGLDTIRAALSRIAKVVEQQRSD